MTENLAVFQTQLPRQSEGKLMLQQCGHCHKVSYPPRELCGHCLADQLTWREQPQGGTLLAVTTLHYSLEPLFKEQLPLRIGSIQLACGPIVIAHLAPDITAKGQQLQVITKADPAGNLVLYAQQELSL